MKPLVDETFLTRYPAKLCYAAGNARFYQNGESKELFYQYDLTNCYNKSIVCTFLRKSRFNGNATFIRRLNQPFFSIEYLFSGRMYVKSGDVAYIAEAGDICLLHEHGNHEFLIDPELECVKAGIVFRGPLLDSILAGLGLDCLTTIPFSDQNRFDHFMTKLKDAMSKPATSATHDEIAGIVYEFLQAMAAVAAEARSAMPSEVLAIMNELRGNFGIRLSMRALATKYDMTVQTMNLKFKTYLNTTAYQYLIRQRMNAAKQYLFENTLSIKEIAEKVGFDNPLSFSTAFRQYYGKSPRKYCRNEGD